ncbi:MAG: hypothetical protein ABI839_02255 [Verrucomicrobiota bacterium]
MKLRVFIGSALIATLVAAFILASAPDCHRQLHGAESGHQCAATLLASGQWTASAPPPAMLPLVRVPMPACVEVDLPVLVSAAISRSILEHAPPRLS